MKKTSLLLALLLLVLCFSSCAVKYGKDTDASIWKDSTAYAAAIKNSIVSKFTDRSRTEYVLSNKTMSLTRDMTSDRFLKSFADSNGIIYFNTEPYQYIELNGTEYTSHVDENGARMNAGRIGYYYTDLWMLDQYAECGNKTVYFEQKFHTYAEKLHIEYCYRATNDDAFSASEYGAEYRFPVSSVEKYRIDINGVYAVFDFKNAGVLGFIVSDSGKCGRLSVSENDGFYILRQTYSAPSALTKKNPVSFACRLYNDDTHSFDGFHAAVIEETEPAKISVTNHESNAVALGYNVLNGAYETSCNGSDFNSAYYKTPDQHYKTNLMISEASSDRKIYIRAKTPSGALENAVLLDENEKQLAMQLEVSKNFAGEMEEKIYDYGDQSYGEALFPISLKKEESRSMTVVHLYQNWGKTPLKQLSSIQFIIPYYHFSYGVTETNCIAPYYVLTDGWTLPDFRAMSASLWSSQPQHNSAGRSYILYCKTPDTPDGWLEYDSAKIDSSGPTYTDITTFYSSDNSIVSASYRHTEFAQSDENRTYYNIDITFNENLTVENAQDNFILFAFDSREETFRNIGFLDESNESVTNNLTGLKSKEIFKLGSNCPYFDIYSNDGEFCNSGMIIRNFSATIGGKEYTDGLYLRCDNRERVSLVLGGETLSFKKGDSIHINSILLPFGDPYVRNDNSVRYVRNDSALYPLITTASRGKIISDIVLPTISVDENEVAVFTLTGGRNINAVRVCGFDSSDKIAVYEIVDDKAVLYDFSNYAYDGYTVYKNNDGTFDFAFNVHMGAGLYESRTFKVVQN